MTKKTTIIFIVAATAALVIWDFVVAGNKVEGDTISEVIWDWSRQTPMIPFVVGFVCGHLFFRRNDGKL